VVSAFNDVQASLVNADQARNEAEAKRNDIIPRAQGQAIQIKQEAEAYRESQVAAAQGEASRFEQILKAYHKNRQVAIKRYYFESMQQILGQVDKIIMDSKSSQGILPYLPLTELKKKVQAKESNG
jgi:modulator of FtsH protease HflK